MELFNDDYEDTVSVRSKIVKPIKGGFLFKWYCYIWLFYTSERNVKFLSWLNNEKWSTHLNAKSMSSYNINTYLSYLAAYL